MSDTHYDHINKLIEKAQLDDNEAFEELYEFYQPLVKAAIRKCVCSDFALSKYKDDLISIACIEFSKLVKNFDISRSFFSYYISNRLYPNLLKSANSLINNSENYEINFSDMPKLWDPEDKDPFAQIELEIIISNALSQLKPQHKQAVELVYYEQLTQEEAAEKLDITQSAFSKRLKAALKELKNKINFF